LDSKADCSDQNGIRLPQYRPKPSEIIFLYGFEIIPTTVLKNRQFHIFFGNSCQFLSLFYRCRKCFSTTACFQTIKLLAYS
jgi:hypothetical protein